MLSSDGDILMQFRFTPSFAISPFIYGTMLISLFLSTHTQVVYAQQLCGNGVVEGSEQCDDGNDRAGDGCFQCQLSSDIEFVPIPAGSYHRGSNSKSNTKPVTLVDLPAFEISRTEITVYQYNI